MLFVRFVENVFGLNDQGGFSMKLGILTGIWSIGKEMTLLDSLEKAAALGFRYVDLHGVFHAGPKHLLAEARREIRSRMKSLGLTPRNYVLHSPHNPAGASASQLEESYRYLCEGIDMAAGWQIRQLMLNAGTWTFGIDRAKAWDQAVGFIRRVCDYAASRDLYIAQESEPYVWFLVNDIASTARMIEAVDRPNFTVLIDIGHMALAREGEGEFALLADRTIHAHLSDHEPLRHSNQVVGTGFTPSAQYLQMLQKLEMDSRMKKFGYDELVVSFELGFPGDRIEDPDDWVLRSIQHIRNAAPFISL
jgi:sugar phosphate isomerase/epimerase